MKQGRLATKLLLGVFVAVALTLAAVFAFSQVPQASAADNASNWNDFKAAVAKGGTVNLADYVDDKGALVAEDGPIVVSNAVTIEGDGTIYRKAGNLNFPVFRVETANGNLTLGKGVVLSGKLTECNGGDLYSYDNIKPQTKPGDNEISLGSPVEKTKWVPQYNATFAGLNGQKILIAVTESNRGHGKELEDEPGVGYVNSNGEIWLAPVANVLDENGYFLSGINESDYTFEVVEVEGDQNPAKLMASNGKFIGRPTGTQGDAVKLLDDDSTDTHVLLTPNDQLGSWKFEMGGGDNQYARYLTANETSVNDVHKRYAIYNQSRGMKGLNYFYTAQTEYTWTVNGEPFTDEVSAQQAVDAYNAAQAVTTYVVDGLEGSPFASEEAAKQAIDAANAANQGRCDGSPANCTTITSSDFKSGVPENPRAFFVKVEDGATATLNGATLTDFITDKTVMHVAPVVAHNATFNMVDGEITGNSVGYGANNSQAQWNAAALGTESELGNYAYNGYLGWDEAAKTETAGGVIYTAGAKGTISGGKIANNRGDTGGVIVQGIGQNDADTETWTGAPSKVYVTGGEIDSNIGLHHAGGMLVFNGAAVQLEKNGSITKNFSWHKGGGVFVAEEALGSMNLANNGRPAKKQVGDATFIMNGGHIDGNVAIHRGGGIEVMSNHVSLYGGTINGNNSRVLGGGIYVEGDAGRMYQMYMANGCITGNRALTVAEQSTIPTWWSETSPNTCGFKNEFQALPAGRDVTYLNGFWGEQGDGGGVWLCPLGGNSTFAIDGDHNVIISGNSASSGVGHGADLFVTAPRGGVGNGVNVVTQGANQFTIEGTDEVLEDGASYAGMLALVNNGQTCDGGSLVISKNTATNGGGIAANGTVVFGEGVNTYRTAASIDITKAWGAQRDQGPVTVQMFAEIDGKRVEFGNEYNPFAGAKAVLNGTADELVTEVSEDSTLSVDQYTANDSAYESSPWVATLGLPTKVAIDGQNISLFTVKVNGEEYDPANQADLQTVYELYRDGKVVSAEASDWNLVVVETDAKGNELEYKLPMGGVVLEKIENEAAEGQPVTYVDIDDNVILEIGTYTTKFAFAQTIGNDTEPEVEKYVNKDVHDDIVNFDQEFTYDIMAYVPMDATEFSISDELVDALEFADAEGNATTDATKAVLAISTKGHNDHTPGGTVAADAIDTIAVDGHATIAGNKLLVSVTDEESLAVARGKWVQVTFNARIKDALRTLEALKSAGWAAVDDNGPVISDQAHEGIGNKATYTVAFGNNPASNYDTNTVTVKPEETSLTVDKAWKLGEEASGWPKGAVVSVQLTANGEAVNGKTATLDAQSTSYTFQSLPCLKGVVYGVAEANVTGTDWRSTPTVEGEGTTFTITNALTPEGPEIEKYVSTDVHKDVTLDETFTYDIIAYVTKDAEKVEITDTLKDVLQFVSTPETVSVKALDNSAVDHTPKSGAWITAGEDVDAAIDIDGKTLTVTIDPAVDYQGKWIKVTFAAKIADGLTLADLDGTYRTVEPGKLFADDDTVFTEGNRPEENLGNLPVISDQKHEGVPNTSSYRIGVGNDWKYTDESNTVTVKPRVVKISKTDLGGTELEGAKIKVEGPNFTEEWISTTEAHSLVLEPGDYTMVEVVAPEGYQQVTTTIGFTVAEDGTVTVTTTEVEGGEIELAEDGTIILKDAPVKEPEPENEKPEIEKYINKDVHQDLASVDEAFTYDIVAYVTNDADYVQIFDTLVKNLVFANGADTTVTVADLGEANNHKTDGSYTSTNADATVSAAGAAVDAVITIDGQTLTVDIADATALRGHYVRVTFDAKVAEDAGYVTIDENGTVLSDKSHTGIPNKAGYRIGVGNDWKYNLDSNVVTVTPPTPVVEEFPVLISKTDLGGTEIEGATITVTGPDNISETWTSTTEPHELQLKPGEYTMVEVVAPEGYQTVTTEMKFRVNEDGSVELITTTVNNGGKIEVMDGNHVVLADAPEKTPEPETPEPEPTPTPKPEPTPTPTPDEETFPVVISKQDITDSSELPGAVIKVTDEDGNVVDQWTSTDKPHELQLKPGTYTMEEVNAPEGFDAITTTITFVVDDKGNVTLTGAYEDINGKIEVKDLNHLILSDLPTKTPEPEPKPTPEKTFPVVISKQDITDSSELPGAVIKITDEAGNVVDQWTSTDKPHELQLKPGRYTLEEVNAPEGFQAITTVVTFVVDENGKVTLEGAYEDINGAIAVQDVNHLVLSDLPNKVTVEEEPDHPDTPNVTVEKEETPKTPDTPKVEEEETPAKPDAPKEEPKTPAPTVEDEEEPAKVNPPTTTTYTPTPASGIAPSTSVQGTAPVKTGDLAGMAVVGTMLIGLFAAGAAALARRRASRD